MDLLGLKIKSIRDRLGINDEFGKIYSFIDFGNINYWFEKDTKDCDDNMLLLEEKMVIDLEKLANFSNLVCCMSSRIRLTFSFQLLAFSS